MGRIVRLLMLVSLPFALSGAAWVTIAHAVAPTQIETQQKALKDARARAADARRRANRLEAEAENATQQAEKLAKQRAALRAEIAEAEADIDAAEVRIALLERKRRRHDRLLAKQMRPNMQLLAALQSMARKPVILAYLEPKRVSDIVHTRLLIDAIGPQIAERTKGLRAQAARSRQLTKQEKLASNELKRSRDTLATRRATLAQNEARSRQRAGNLGSEADRERQRALGLGEQAQDLVEAIDVSRQDTALANKLSAIDAPRFAKRDAPDSAGPAAYRLPVEGRLMSGLGDESNFGFRAKGLTFAVEGDEPAYAPAAGKIVFAGEYRSFGEIVIIDHGAGWTTLVTGLDGLAVSDDDRIDQGQLLGRTDAKKKAVTVELRRKGRPMDLIALLK